MTYEAYAWRDRYVPLDSRSCILGVPDRNHNQTAQGRKPCPL